MHAREVHAHEMHACEIHAREVHAREVRAREVHAREMHAHEMHAHETHACETHPRKVYACVRGARLYMQVYEIYVAVGAHLGGTRLGDTSVRCSLPVNVYEILGEF